MKKKLSLAALFLALFLLLILVVSTVDVAAIGPEGTKVGLSQINGAVRDAVGLNMTLYKVTKYMGYAAILLAVCILGLGAWQCVKRGSIKKVDRSIWLLAAVYALFLALYLFFEKVIVNYRPVIIPGDTAPEASFPSTHTMLFCMILGSAAMAAGVYMKDPKKRTLAQVVCVVWAVVGVLFRLGSGVHWLSDIVGGLLISAAVLLAFSALLDRKKTK
ncbi:MAG: phosphatase PAP2 family protein [Clostridia bacterium]|nr:phosphatase PAP2 family protein [Clostridia bacterium]